jgi:hypothetical protein
MTILDLYSKDWIHKKFNISYLKQFSNIDTLFIGRGSAEYFEYVINNKVDIENSKLKAIKTILFSKDITFLVLLNKYFPIVVILILLGKNVSYVIHKYNNLTRLNKFYNLIYQFLERIGLKSLSFEPVDSRYLNNKILNSDLYSSIDILPVISIKRIKKIIFIGEPSKGKNFELLKLFSKKNNIIINIYSDTFNDRYKEANINLYKHSDKIDGDIIWAFYDKDIYSGIQSGLCYDSLGTGIPLFTNNNVAFIKFSREFSSYILPCNQISCLRRML